MKCLICKSKNIKLETDCIYFCSNCNSFFRDSNIDYKIYKKYHFDPDWLELQQKNQANYFERDLILSSSIIEFGSCWGDIIGKLAFFGNKNIACDIKKLLREEYRTYIKEIVGTFEKVVKQKIGKFNNVIMNNTIEHINNPNNTFKEVYRILNKKGHFMFITEDADNHFLGLLNMIFHPEHRFIFGRKGIEYLAKKYRFKIIRYDNLFFNNAIYVALKKI